MSRPTYPSLTTRIRTALAKGAPLPHDTITLYRAGRHGKLHQHDTCAKRTGLTPIEIPIHGPGSIATFTRSDFCSQCSTRTDWDRCAWDDWVTLAERIVDIDTDLADPASPSTVADRHRQLASIRSLLDLDTHSELHLTAQHTIDRLDASIAVLLETHDPTAHLIAAAAATMTVNCRHGELPALDDSDDTTGRPSVFPRDHDRYSPHLVQAHPALRRLWATWSEVAINTSNLDEATTVALAAAAEVIAGAATPFEHVPTEPHYAGNDFPNPLAWAAAEWAYVAARECERWCADWTNHVMTWIARGELTVLVDGYNPAASCQVSQRVAESVATHPRAVQDSTMFASIPRVLFDFIDGQIGHYHGHTRWNRPTITIIDPQPSTQAELAVAAGLYDLHGDGALSDPAAALEAARSVVA